MASVTTMIVHSVRDQANGSLYVRYKFDLLDNLNGNHIVITQSKNVVVPQGQTQEEFLNANMIATAPTILADKANQEQQLYQDRASEGEMVLHQDMGGWFDKITPLWETWDVQATEWLTYWLSLTNQLELVHIQLDIAQISNTNLNNLLGINQSDTTDIRSAVQIAVDTKATLDTYQPFYKSGVWQGAA